MSLWKRLEQEIEIAVRSGDDFARDTLRFFKSNLGNLRINLQVNDLTDDHIISQAQKEIKQRKESAEALRQAGANDRADKELKEIDLLITYLPDQLSDAEVGATVLEYLKANPTTQKEMGSAMKELSAQLKGRADMGLVSKILRENLS